MLQKLQLLFALLLISQFTFAQHPTCDGVRYLADTFVVDTTFAVTFGNSTTVSGVNSDLKMDIFQPAGDQAAQRPVILLAFGGSFVGGQREDMHFLCEYYARRGYIAAAIDYRVYDGALFPLPDSVAFTDVVIKAVSDMRAAVRFFREDAATTNTYKADPNYIFVGGISAGAITASHVAFVDSTDTYEPFVLTSIQNNGGWEGNSSNNTQYSSEVQGVINYSGALRKMTYIDANDPPLFSVHDDADNTVPYARGSAVVVIFPIIVIEGSSLMHAEALSKGVNSQLITIPNSTGHVSYFGSNSTTWQDTVQTASLNFLNDILCPASTATIGLAKEEVAATVYPNPSPSDLIIELPYVPAAYTISLVDNMGRIVYTKENISDNRLVIPRNNLAGGLYHLQMNFDAPHIAPFHSKVIFR